jgi:hypothetical protein
MNVATLPWLLRHELHLWWRELNSKPGLKTWGIVLGFLSLVVLVPLWFALTEIRQTLVGALAGGATGANLVTNSHG